MAPVRIIIIITFVLVKMVTNQLFTDILPFFRFIRKTCHLTRWGFRSCHKDWKPERIFPISMEDERMQLSVVPCEDPTEGVEHDESSCQQYGDTNLQRCTYCHSVQLHSHSCCSTEESTMISDVSFLDNDVECAPIAIAPENVSVVHEDDDDADGQGEPFFKNTQHVIMV